MSMSMRQFRLKHWYLPGRVKARLVITSDGCHEWQGAKTKGGYGAVRWGGKMVYVHRLVWTYQRGPIPPGLSIDHLCFNRICANVEHMEVVTLAENTRRGRARYLARLREG